MSLSIANFLWWVSHLSTFILKKNKTTVPWGTRPCTKWSLPQLSILHESKNMCHMKMVKDLTRAVSSFKDNFVDSGELKNGSYVWILHFDMVQIVCCSSLYNSIYQSNTTRYNTNLQYNIFTTIFTVFFFTWTYHQQSLLSLTKIFNKWIISMINWTSSTWAVLNRNVCCHYNRFPVTHIFWTPTNQIKIHL